MTDITYQAATTGLTGQSAFLSRISTWCAHLVEGVREGQYIAARYRSLSQLPERNSPAAALTVTTSREPLSPAIEAFLPDFC